jgi:hypothetical protein
METLIRQLAGAGGGSERPDFADGLTYEEEEEEADEEGEEEEGLPFGLFLPMTERSGTNEGDGSTGMVLLADWPRFVHIATAVVASWNLEPGGA